MNGVQDHHSTFTRDNKSQIYFAHQPMKWRHIRGVKYNAFQLHLHTIIYCLYDAQTHSEIKMKKNTQKLFYFVVHMNSEFYYFLSARLHFNWHFDFLIFVFFFVQIWFFMYFFFSGDATGLPLPRAYQRRRWFTPKWRWFFFSTL